MELVLHMSQVLQLSCIHLDAVFMLTEAAWRVSLAWPAAREGTQAKCLGIHSGLCSEPTDAQARSIVHNTGRSGLLYDVGPLGLGGRGPPIMV